MPKTLLLLVVVLFFSLVETGYPVQVPHHGYLVNEAGSSRECLGCHNGESAPHAATCLRGSCPIEGPHPIDAPYPPPGREAEYVPRFGMMNDGVRLYDGRVSCISCHNLQNPQPNHPAVDLASTNLCLHCHIK